VADARVSSFVVDMSKVSNLIGHDQEHLAKPTGAAPEALLAGEDDAGVLGDGRRHLPHEARVWLHVGAAQPEAAHAPGAHLLQQADRVVGPLRHEDGDLHRALQPRLAAPARKPSDVRVE